ncbi:histidine kinase-like ATPase [Tribonema minus]|uniref:histidine kinase n=1 Tax=Tribonema minus TaxID=303371 RepID=A0A835ZEK2_9STRA|nr:histidine kinase-like ATPase [Tribonema minus]
MSAGEGSFYSDWRVLQPDGSTIHLKCRAEVCTAESSGEKHLVGICLDISETVRLSRDVVEAERHSESRLFQLIRTTCHEIRNPLQGMIGCAETQLLLLEKVMGSSKTNDDMANIMAELKSLASDIHACANHQACVITDLLDFEREISDAPQPVCCATNITHAHNTSLVLHIPKQLWVSTDVRLTKRIMINLVSNAVKFTDNGTIHISAQHKSDTLTMEVSDNGCGIPDDFKKNIFHVTGCTSQSEYITGSGLGLCIVNQLTNSLGGTISFKDNKPKGTVFTLVVPCEPSLPGSPDMASKDSWTSDDPCFSELDIVVADDNIVNRKVLSRMLQTSFRQVIVVEDGALAVATFESNNPSFVILDVHMPIMDGLKAASIIRKADASVPIIFLTGEIGDSLVNVVHQLKPSQLLLKPVSKNKLLHELKQFRLQNK